MLQIYCPVCNGLLQLKEGQKEAVCVNCGNTVAVPQGYTEAESSYLFAAEAMQRRDFETARQAYGEILERHPDQAEAWFRRALASYEIEYQKTESGVYRLICHQAEKGDFRNDADVKKALAAAQGSQREEYERLAEEIHSLQERVSAYARAHRPADVWLSVSGDSLASLNRAVQIRQLLDTMGLTVFCPALDLLEEEEGEPALYRAASTAGVMVIAAAEAEAFTEEVNFAAERFLYRKGKALRAAKGQIPTLIAVIENLDEYEDIPDSYFDGIDLRLHMGRESFAAELKEAVSGALADYRGALREQAGTHESFDYANLLLQARQTLERRSFEEAKTRYQEILLKRPTESQAYWGLLLAERGCASEQELIEAGVPVGKENNYRNALAFATEREQQTYRETAARTEELAAVRAEQQRERDRFAREQEEERRRKEAEVQEAGRRKNEQERRVGRRRTARVRLFASFAVILLAAAAIGYFVYSKSPAGVTAKQYKEAQTAYSHGQYQEAYDIFRELEDYKDSAHMAEVCETQLMQTAYFRALEQLGDMSARAGAVSEILRVSSRIQEAEGVLSEIHAEGVQYLEEGKAYEAWNTLKSFGAEDPDMVRAWRLAFGRGVFAGSRNGKIVGLDKEGNLTSFGLDGGFVFEEGKAISVALNDRGTSAGAVRQDGTAYLLGEVSALSVEGWSDLVSIRVSDSLAAGLTSGGDLYMTGRGIVASDVRQFDVNGSYLIAVRHDGSIYCTNPSARIPAEWSGIDYAVLIGDAVLAVTREGKLLQSGTDYDVTSENVVAVYYGCEKIGFLYADGRIYSVGYGGGGDKITDNGGYFAAFSRVPSQDVDLFTEKNGSIVGIIYGVDDEDIAMGRAIQAFPYIDIPGPQAAEEGEGA